MGKKEKSKTIFHISNDQIAELNSLNFEWDPWEAQWLEMYYKLKKHYETHGRTNTTDITDKAFVRWIDWNRRSCKLEKRIILLNSIGFRWTESCSRNADIRSCNVTDATTLTNNYKYS